MCIHLWFRVNGCADSFGVVYVDRFSFFFIGEMIIIITQGRATLMCISNWTAFHLFALTYQLIVVLGYVSALKMSDLWIDVKANQTFYSKFMCNDSPFTTLHPLSLVPCSAFRWLIFFSYAFIPLVCGLCIVHWLHCIIN